MRSDEGDHSSGNENGTVSVSASTVDRSDVASIVVDSNGSSAGSDRSVSLLAVDSRDKGASRCVLPRIIWTRNEWDESIAYSMRIILVACNLQHRSGEFFHLVHRALELQCKQNNRNCLDGTTVKYRDRPRQCTEARKHVLRVFAPWIEQMRFSHDSRGVLTAEYARALY